MSEINLTDLSLEVTEKTESSEVEIAGEIPVTVLAPYRTAALTHFTEHADVPGFRKGHVPEKIVLERIGENAVLFEATERALGTLYPAIIKEKELNVIGRPEISITKLAPGNPVGFKITAALMPTITLPDYKEVAKDVMSAPEVTEVTETEIQQFVDNVRKQAAQQNATPENPEPELPEITDEFIKTLGDFTDVADFNEKVKLGLSREKAGKAREKKRIETSDKIIEAATVPLPRVIIDSELDKMLGQFKEEIKRSGLSFDDYLTRIKKSEADLRGEWEPDAAKRAKLQLTLNEIARTENITPDPKMVEHEVEHIKEHVKDADPDRLKLYVESMLTNEEVFKFLEAQGTTPKTEPEEKSEEK